MGRSRQPNRGDYLLSAVVATQQEIATIDDDVEQVMRLVCERSSALVGASGGVVEIVDGEFLEYRAATGMVEPFRGLRLPAGGSMSGACVAARRPLTCDDSETDPRVDREACRRIGLRSMLCVPLEDDGTVTGVLKVVSAEPSAFTMQHSDALALLARMIVVAMRRAEAKAELLHQNELLRAADAVKDVLVSTVSHELRTPLSATTGYLDIVLEGEAGPLTAEQREFLDIARSSADRVVRLAEDLLAVGRIRHSKADWDSVPVDLRTLIRHAVIAARPRAVEQQVRIQTRLRATPPVVGDAGKLAQVIDNLVGNAVKYTPAGGHVSVSLSAADGSAWLRVRDTGIGIPEEEQRHVFEPFFRSSTATDRAIKGTGLGLSITREIVLHHGGTLEVSSRPGEGTTFSAALPLAA